MILIDKKTNEKRDVRLPKIFKKKWVAALKSGKYKQGTGRLVTSSIKDNCYEEKFCCIGVACRISHPRFKSNATAISKRSYKGRIRDLKIPKLLIGDYINYNFNNDRSNDDYNPIVEKLVIFNESLKYSFIQIADWVEENL
jgi:hypothetical protein